MENRFENYPLLVNLVLADNDVHYINDNGERTEKPVDIQAVKDELRKRKEDRSKKI